MFLVVVEVGREGGCYNVKTSGDFVRQILSSVKLSFLCTVNIF